MVLNEQDRFAAGRSFFGIDEFGVVRIGFSSVMMIVLNTGRRLRRGGGLGLARRLWTWRSGWRIGLLEVRVVVRNDTATGGRRTARGSPRSTMVVVVSMRGLLLLLLLFGLIQGTDIPGGHGRGR